MATTYRMLYDSEVCVKHYQSYTTTDLKYICRWYGVISSREIALALGRTQKSILNKAEKMKKSGEFEKFKLMYERI